MKIYTKTGDAGTTGLFGGPRVDKDHPRICSYGEIDELNALLGMVRSVGCPESIDEKLLQVQRELFAIGAELATPDPDAHGMKWSGEAPVALLEQWIDQLDEGLAPLRNFILPGGSVAAAHLHLARTTCRRAERNVVSLGRQPQVSDPSQIIIYLNRLSDLLFVMARWCNAERGVADIPWLSQRKGKELPEDPS
ncbi:MAG: cob(I)yrinic acid a,c-diamide adenosyltransferase [Pirellulaceae bacterium]|jgi:cob(I)alamin adenosyltransferase